MYKCRTRASWRIAVIIGSALALWATDVTAEGNRVEDQVLEVLMAQQLAWNRGDIPGFMEAYLKSEDLRFLSADIVETGWQTMIERYRRNSLDGVPMGKIDYSDMDIRVLSDEYAFVSGRFTQTSDSNRFAGLFTLLFLNTDDGWRIVHDHTSAAPSGE